MDEWVALIADAFSVDVPPEQREAADTQITQLLETAPLTTVLNCSHTIVNSVNAGYPPAVVAQCFAILNRAIIFRLPQHLKRIQDTWKDPKNMEQLDVVHKAVTCGLGSTDIVIQNLSTQTYALLLGIEGSSWESGTSNLIKQLSDPEINPLANLAILKIFLEILKLPDFASEPILCGVQPQDQLEIFSSSAIAALDTVYDPQNQEEADFQVELRLVATDTLQNFITAISRHGLQVLTEITQRRDFFSQVIDALPKSLVIPHQRLYQNLHSLLSTLYTDFYQVAPLFAHNLIFTFTANAIDLSEEFLCPLLMMWHDIALFEATALREQRAEMNFENRHGKSNSNCNKSSLLGYPVTDPYRFRAIYPFLRELPSEILSRLLAPERLSSDSNVNAPDNSNSNENASNSNHSIGNADDCPEYQAIECDCGRGTVKLGFLSKMCMGVFLEKIVAMVGNVNPEDTEVEDLNHPTSSMYAISVLKFFFVVQPQRILNVIELHWNEYLASDLWTVRHAALLLLTTICMESPGLKQRDALQSYFPTVLEAVRTRDNIRIADTAIFLLGKVTKTFPDLFFGMEKEVNRENLLIAFRLISPDDDAPPCLLERYAHMLQNLFYALRLKTVITNPLLEVFQELYEGMKRFLHHPNVVADLNILTSFAEAISGLIHALPGTKEEFRAQVHRVFYDAIALISRYNPISENAEGYAHENGHENGAVSENAEGNQNGSVSEIDKNDDVWGEDEGVRFTRQASACAWITTIILRQQGGFDDDQMSVDLFRVLLQLLKRHNPLIYREALMALALAVRYYDGMRPEQVLQLSIATNDGLSSGSPEVIEAAALVISNLCQYQEDAMILYVGEAMQHILDLFRYYVELRTDVLPGLIKAISSIFYCERNNAELVEQHLEDVMLALTTYQSLFPGEEDYEIMETGGTTIANAYRLIGLAIFAQNGVRNGDFEYCKNFLGALFQFTKMALSLSLTSLRFARAYADCYAKLIEVVPRRLNTKLINGNFFKLMRKFSVEYPEEEGYFNKVTRRVKYT